MKTEINVTRPHICMGNAHTFNEAGTKKGGGRECQGTAPSPLFDT